MNSSKFQIAKCDPLTLMPITGRSKIGKSFCGNFMSEAADLYDNPLVGKLDLDEKNDRDYQRYHGNVIATPMRDFDDITRILSKLPPGCRLTLCDTPGAFQTFASKITEKQDFLFESNITFVPVLVTLDQGIAGALVQTWLEIFQHCKKAFILQNVIEDPCGIARVALTLPEGIAQPTDIEIMMMPFLHKPFANEMSRVAARITQVINGEIQADESEILAMPLTRQLVSTWAIQAEKALAPLTDFILKTIQSEPAPAKAKSAAASPTR